MKIYISAGIIFGLIGIGFLISTVFTTIEYLHFKGQSEVTKGIVKSMETRPETSSSPGSRAIIYSDYAFIEFMASDNLRYTIEKLIYPGLEIKVGDELSINYMTTDPSQATLDFFWDKTGWMIISIFFGFIFTIGGYFSLREGIKEYKASNSK